MKSDEDDFDTFLDDCGIGKVTHKIETKSVKEEQPSKGGGSCYPLLIGGSALANGWTEHRLAPKSCSKLRCT